LALYYYLLLLQGAQIGAGGTESHGPLTLTTDYHYAEKYVQLEADRTVAVCITRRKLDPICELRNTLAYTRALLFSQHLLFLFADFNDCNGEKNCLKSVKRNERFCKNNSGPEGTGFLDHGVFIIKFEKFQKSLRNHKACKSLKFS